MMLAGEASGDAHAAEVVERLRALHPSIRVSGMGSERMKAAGVELFFDAASIAVVGIVEVLRHWGEIKQAMAMVRTRLEQDRPDLLVLVDYPEFNLKMARHAKALGIPVLFYISPQVWAWRPKRIRKIGESIDHMAVLFRFEEDFYRRAGIPVSFVGHPLVDKVKPSTDAASERARLGIPDGARVVGLFPGSRRSEIARLLPLLLDTAEWLRQRHDDLHFLLPVAETLDHAAIEAECARRKLPLTLTRDRLYDVIPACDAIASCSGTVTLEIALLETPLCIVYRMSWLSWQIMSRLVTIEHIGLANIVGAGGAVRELLQNDATPQAIGGEIEALLDDGQHRQQVIEGLQRVRANLGEGDGAGRMARLVLRMAGAQADDQET
jgi:lipid-A-disaccharide synthase